MTYADAVVTDAVVSEIQETRILNILSDYCVQNAERDKCSDTIEIPVDVPLDSPQALCKLQAMVVNSVYKLNKAGWNAKAYITDACAGTITLLVMFSIALR